MGQTRSDFKCFSCIHARKVMAGRLHAAIAALPDKQVIALTRGVDRPWFCDAAVKKSATPPEFYRTAGVVRIGGPEAAAIKGARLELVVVRGRENHKSILFSSVFILVFPCCFCPCFKFKKVKKQFASGTCLYSVQNNNKR
jgi:hypothetical protein